MILMNEVIKLGGEAQDKIEHAAISIAVKNIVTRAYNSVSRAAASYAFATVGDTTMEVAMVERHQVFAGEVQQEFTVRGVGSDKSTVVGRSEYDVKIIRGDHTLHSEGYVKQAVEESAKRGYHEKSTKGMRYDYVQITAKEKNVENLRSQEGGAKKIPKGEEEIDIVPETFAEAPTEEVEEGSDVENFPEITSHAAREAAAGNMHRPEYFYQGPIFLPSVIF